MCLSVSAGNLSPLKKQQALLTAEPSRQPQELLIIFLKSYITHLRKILEIVSVCSEFHNLLFRAPHYVCFSFLQHTVFYIHQGLFRRGWALYLNLRSWTFLLLSGGTKTSCYNMDMEIIWISNTGKCMLYLHTASRVVCCSNFKISYIRVRT